LVRFFVGFEAVHASRHTQPAKALAQAMESAFLLADKESPSGVFVRWPTNRPIVSAALMNGCFKALQSKPLRRTRQELRYCGRRILSGINVDAQ
jgi:hypothetical protein